MAIHYPPDGILRALTVREPFASLIVMGIKKAETRVWSFPGIFTMPCTIAIHVSADDSSIGDDLDNICESNAEAGHAFDNQDCEPCVIGKDYFYSQAVIGLVDVVACIAIDPTWTTKRVEKEIVKLGFDSSYATWCNPPYAFLLANPRRFRQGITTRGQVKVWRLTPNVQQHCEQASSDLLTSSQSMPSAPLGLPKCLGTKT